MRDSDGNALRNSHVVGFFRRICKLLYFGIKPVFVFDGAAPLLKRETVRRRRMRREGRREDAGRTAGRLLGVQMARLAEEEEKKRRQEREMKRVRAEVVEEEVPEDEAEMVYVDEVMMDSKERQAGRQFKKKDQYHLPDLDVSIESMGGPNDPRIMSQGELEDYARHFHSGEDVSIYDFSKIDYESAFFLSLPASDRYNILNAARLRSRLRMGYSKEQLDTMFPDRMAFSKFQVERVKERNELTQRLMHINGMAEDFLDQGGRIAGEKGKEYVLVRNEGVEGGWALGVVSNKNKGQGRENAIDVDEDLKSESSQHSSDNEDAFEDVPVEGLNRIPKSMKRRRKQLEEFSMDQEDAAEQIARKRQAVYDARKRQAVSGIDGAKGIAVNAEKQDDGLFVADTARLDVDDDAADELFEDVAIAAQDEETDDDLQKAIEMSLQQPDDDALSNEGGFLPEPKQSAPAKARGGFEVSDDDDDDLDLQAALSESRNSKYKSTTNVRDRSPPIPKSSTPQHNFSGPLPFESLNLGQSLLGKKKADKIEHELSGGFEKKESGLKAKPAAPLPSWFEESVNKARPRQSSVELNEGQQDGNLEMTEQIQKDRREMLRRGDTQVIDLEAASDSDSQEVVSIHSEESLGDEKEDDIEIIDDVEFAENKLSNEIHEGEPVLPAEKTAIPEDAAEDFREDVQRTKNTVDSVQSVAADDAKSRDDDLLVDAEMNEDEVDWSESDHVEETAKPSPVMASSAATNGEIAAASAINGAPRSDTWDQDQDFEEVSTAPVTNKSASPEPGTTHQEALEALEDEYLIADSSEDETHPTTNGTSKAQPSTREEDDLYISDDEEEIMRALAAEAEENARFAAEINNTRTPAAAKADFEAELKTLRAQQKKDRRDADEVTQTMVMECQALLRLFGLPYITAPMEAEAQCATLVELGLVDGIVTDDSDCFLFGGTRVYKNMFNSAKFVECYLLADLEKEFALTRQRMIRFAHLLGSDYTEGIPGVGPVTALEIVTDFDDLKLFKKWCADMQQGRLDGNLNSPFRRKFKKQAATKLILPAAFPDVRVDDAYLEPEVDKDDSDFEWGVPDLDQLRNFLMATIGWGPERVDEILVPVIRDMNKRGREGTQANLTRFFSGGVGAGAKELGAPRVQKTSGRMEKAFGRLRGEAARLRRRGEDSIEEGAPAEGHDGHDNQDGGTSEGRDKPQPGSEPRKAAPKKAGRDRKKVSIAAPSPDETENSDDAASERPKVKRGRRAPD